jgi:hypothetical protein
MQSWRISIARVVTACALLAGGAGAAQESLPAVGGPLGAIPEKFREFEVILEPPVNEAEWWAGAPSVCRDADGVFWLACRMRTAESPRGLRGYELQILRSGDGVRFERVKTIHRDDVPIPGFERPALLIDPATGHFKLYACGPWQGGPWGIIKFDDVRNPADFDPATARLVIGPAEKEYDRDIRPVEYKDPVIVHAAGRYHAYVTGYLRQNERIYHFVSDDGEAWEPVGDRRRAVMDLVGWHDFFIRPASVLPLGVGYLFVYEGSSASWHDPVYNIATGLAFTFDLEHLTDLTPEAPLAVSSTPSPRFATFRYSDWLWVDGEIWVYAEVARPNESHEIRLFRLQRG